MCLLEPPDDPNLRAGEEMILASVGTQKLRHLKLG
jgi:hypothetical protein